GDLIVFREESETDEHCYENAHRGGLVNQMGREEEQVLTHSRHGDVVANDVAEQLEEGEYFRHGHQAAEKDGKVKEETRQNVGVYELREKGDSRKERRGCADGRGGQNAAEALDQGREPAAGHGHPVAVAGEIEPKEQ